MRIKVNEKLLSLTFAYEGQPRKTTCMVREVQDGQKAVDGVTLGSATVKQSKRDADNKFQARKYALRNAISGMDRTTRTQIWNEYLKVVRLPGTVKCIECGLENPVK